MNLRPLKDALRAEVLARRNALAPAEHEAFSRQITTALLALEVLIEAECVLLYASFGSELQTHELRHALLERGQSVLLPRAQRETRTLDLYEINEEAGELAPGPWGILEPVPGRCQLISPRNVDFVLVPGVAFDLQGHRLGYGGGYYDDLLARLKPRLTAEQVVAAAFEVQIVPEVPARSKDVPVPYIITEQRLIRANL